MAPFPAFPMVSIIVPARNEEANIGACLESLIAQSGASFEIIVVDDASTDHTPEIAGSFANAHPKVSLGSAPSLPENWTGKNNAMAAGARIAKGNWLLFTDADTMHKNGSLARAVAEAEEHGTALLSYSPEQEVHGFWGKAVMTVIFAELAATYPPKKVNDSASCIAAANGQYLLISREAYHAVGGHAKIAGDLLEDVAMARLVKSSGRRIFFRYGGDAVRTRMYRTWGQMKEGWTKNLALLFPSAIRLALVRLLEFTFTVGAFSAAIILAMRGATLPALVIALFAFGVYASFLFRIRRARFRWDANLLCLFGLPIFSYLLIRSRLAHRKGNVSWKGRRYGDRPREEPRRTVPAQESLRPETIPGGIGFEQ